MKDGQVFEEVKKLIFDYTEVDPARITMEAVLLDLTDDSLNLLEVIIGAEDVFGVEIPDEDSEKIKTVGDLVQFVEKARR